MADVIKTRAQWRDRAAIELGKLQVGQSLEQEDADLVDGFIDDLRATLAADGVCTVDDPEQIPLELFGPLGKLLACACCGAFGGATVLLANNTAQSVAELMGREERRLRRLTASGPTREPVVGEYF